MAGHGSGAIRRVAMRVLFLASLLASFPWPAAVSAQGRGEGRRRGGPAPLATDLPGLQPAIDRALDGGIEYLLARQLRDGAWGDPSGEYGCGQTALCLYTLLESGLTTSHPTVVRGFASLEEVRPAKVYTVACLLLAYGERRDDEGKERMKELLDLLLGWQQNSFGYPDSPPGLATPDPGLRCDLSNTQFAALGLRAARQAGLDVPAKAWEGLLAGTLPYQEDPRTVGTEATEGRSSTGTREVAGFRYRVARTTSAPTDSGRFGGGRFGEGPRPREPLAATGSMTAAGLAILAICREGLGHRLGSRQAGVVQRAEARALAWLADNFAVDRNPGGGRWLNYYLYGLERVGALLERERIGEHDWYLEGARRLVRDQGRDGSWATSQAEPSTCFALLFLQRATAPVSGTDRTRGQVHASTGDVRLRGTGTNPLVLWLEGLDDAVGDEYGHGGAGPRVVHVQYLVDGKPIALVEGDPRRGWDGEQFAHRHSFVTAGRHVVTARVRLVTAGEWDTPVVATADFTTEGFEVTVSNVLADWMLPAARAAAANLLSTVRVTARASSAASADPARAAVDGSEATCWTAASSDVQPTLTLEWETPLRANVITLAGADACLADRGRYDTLVRAEVLVDERHRFSVLFPADPLAPAVLHLDRPRAIRRLDVRLLERIPRSGSRATVGLAEVILAYERN